MTDQDNGRSTPAPPQLATTLVIDNFLVHWSHPEGPDGRVCLHLTPVANDGAGLVVQAPQYVVAFMPETWQAFAGDVERGGYASPVDVPRKLIDLPFGKGKR